MDRIGSYSGGVYGPAADDLAENLEPRTNPVTLAGRHADGRFRTLANDTRPRRQGFLLPSSASDGLFRAYTDFGGPSWRRFSPNLSATMGAGAVVLRSPPGFSLLRYLVAVRINVSCLRRYRPFRPKMGDSRFHSTGPMNLKKHIVRQIVAAIFTTENVRLVIVWAGRITLTVVLRGS